VVPIAGILPNTALGHQLAAGKLTFKNPPSAAATTALGACDEVFSVV